MTVVDLIAHLRRLDVRLKLEGDRLQVSAPKGALNDSLRQELVSRKAEVVEFLKSTTDTLVGEEHRLEKQNRNGDVPLSFGQRRLWFLDQLSAGKAAYSIPGAVRLRGRLDRSALHRALDCIIQRHSILRTTFHKHDGDLVQIVSKADSLDLDFLDLTDRSTDDREREIDRFVEAESRRPFQLERGPLVRGTLLRVEEQDHVLVLNIHHIVTDGWSFSIIIRELGILYEAFCEGGQSPLEPLPLQYSDFARWQRASLSRTTLKKELDYWTTQLAGELPVLELPFAHPRQATPSYAADTLSIELGSELSEALVALSRRERVTLFMTMLSAFKALLSRYTGATDILIGTPIANRQRTELDNMVGFFINTLALRTDLSGDPTFRELLARINEVTIGAYAHQDMPFEELVAELNPRRSVTHAPLVQMMFVVQNAPAEPVQLKGLELTPMELEVHSSELDIDFQILEAPDGFRVFLRYSRDLYERDDIEQFLTNYQRLLESIVQTPDQRISQLTQLPETDRSQVLVDWNATTRPYADGATLADLFELAVKKTPDAIAAICDDRQLSYDQLNGRANQIAHRLQQLGVAPNDLVGICMDRSLEMLASLLGVLKSGAAYVPLDPLYPRDRLAFMLSDAGVKVLVSESRYNDQLPDVSQKILLDSDHETFDRQPDSNPDRTTGAEHLAYVIYTSGSTGKPKGVEVSHSALINFLQSMQSSPGLTSDDCLLAVTTICFDISKLELYLPLICGASLVLATRDESLDGRRLMQLIDDHRVTVMQATPATWRLMLQSEWRDANGVKVLCGGESLSRDLANQILSTGAELWNLYGPTETTIWSTICRVEDGPISIGRPIANTEIYILDDKQLPVPLGVPGELHIGGEGLARGYLNRPQLTDERFLPHPFGPDGSRLYRTGDVARYRPDGRIELLGRRDHQVKLHGFRIELGEIESVLSSHTDVRQATVLVREDNPNDQRLVAYLVGSTEETLNSSELRRHLQSQLPDYMIPSAFISLESLPLTPNGKVDHKKLPEPSGQRPSVDSSFALPRNELERGITKIWQEVLGLDEVGIHDNFFDLGGNSLLMVTVQSQLKDHLGYDIPLIEFFQYPTVNTLARSLTLEQSTEPSLEAIQDRAKRQRLAFGNN